MFQNTMMRVRYSSIPVVVVPQAGTGGGCELSLHADKVIPAAETYTGLVEVRYRSDTGRRRYQEFLC